jgi:hypothetical protein
MTEFKYDLSKYINSEINAQDAKMLMISFYSAYGQELDKALPKFLKAKGYRPQMKEKYVANLQKKLLKSGKVLVYFETPIKLSGLAMSIRYKFDIIPFEEIKSLIPDGSKIVGLIKIEIRNEDEVLKQ